MATPAHDKYYLKSLHEEIDLFDRKLAHSLRYGTFATEAERKASVSKMNQKRELLVRTAKLLASEGIEFKPSDLPRSFRGDEPKEDSDQIAPVEAQEIASIPEVEHTAVRTSGLREFPSPFAGTVLDSRANMVEYKRSRKKATAPQA